MINEILSIFDTSLREKCWIDTYGRLAITGKQNISGKWKKFPISTDVISQERENLLQYFDDLVPNDKKKAVSFWRTITPITYTKVPGVASARRIRKAETTVQFVCWLNLKKISGETDHTNWSSIINGIIKDAVKTLDCRNEMSATGIDGITNLRTEIVGIGDIESWRKAMQEYSIDNLEAISVWPFSGFTLNVKLIFLVRGECMETYTCNTEIQCEDILYVIDENDNILEDELHQIIQ